MHLMVFEISNLKQNIAFGYTYLEENLDNLNINFSRYSINSLKHHFTATYSSQFSKYISQSIAYKFANRTNSNNYSVVDAKITLNLKTF